MHYLYLKYLYFVGTQNLAIVFLLDIFGQTDILSLLQYLKKQFILCWGNIFYICRQLESWLYCLVLMQISGKMLFYCNTWFSFQTHNVANILFLYVVSNIIFDIILSFYFFIFTSVYFCCFGSLVMCTYFVLLLNTSITFTTHLCWLISSFVGPITWFPTLKYDSSCYNLRFATSCP